MNLIETSVQIPVDAHTGLLSIPAAARQDVGLHSITTVILPEIVVAVRIADAAPVVAPAVADVVVATNLPAGLHAHVV
jgi:hypothetical protein